jgi:hypothetical protein
LTLERVPNATPGTLELRETPFPEGFAPPGADESDALASDLPVLVREFETVLRVPPEVALRISATRGSIKMDNRAAATDVHTGAGTVIVVGAAAELRVSNGLGDTMIDKHRGPLIMRVKGTTQVSIEELSGPVEVVNEEGEVIVSLPTTAGFHLVATAHESQVRNGFGLPKEPSGPRGHKVEGDVGGGGPLVSVQALAGTVTVKGGR